jgi:AraC-like DNA-binding protein
VDAGGTRHRQAPVLLAGQLTQSMRIAPGGVARVAGARLRPNGAYALFNLPQHGVTNRVVDLTDIHARAARMLRDHVTGREDAQSLALALDRTLCRLVPASQRSSAIQWALDIALDRRGLIQVQDLSRITGVSDRQLQRAFHEEVGISPKQLLRTLRFQEVLRRVRGQSDDVRWTDLAASCGYYDQAHFVHDFRSFTGESPSAWAIDDAGLTAIFSAIRRV